VLCWLTVYCAVPATSSVKKAESKKLPFSYRQVQISNKIHNGWLWGSKFQFGLYISPKWGTSSPKYIFFEEKCPTKTESSNRLKFRGEEGRATAPPLNPPDPLPRRKCDLWYYYCTLLLPVCTTVHKHISHCHHLFLRTQTATVRERVGVALFQQLINCC